jgi:phosphonate degradation associated HDIG domain protein
METIIKLFGDKGNADYIGEKVSQTEHMIQCALLAKAEGYDDEIIVAALLHDIGHLLNYETMGAYGTYQHEKIGSSFLENLGMSGTIVWLVGNHVNAKRYLVATQPDYYENLSEASRETLKYQGGPMSDLEMLQFKEHPLYLISLKIRQWDELAKVSNLPLPDITSFSNIINKFIKETKRNDEKER